MAHYDCKKHKTITDEREEVCPVCYREMARQNDAMLAALKEANAWLSHGVQSDNKSRARIIIEQAIAKAEGKV